MVQSNIAPNYIPKEIVQQAKEMENQIAQEYAEFAIRCDRMGMKILKFQDWINFTQKK